jgi:hypothetical protein
MRKKVADDLKAIYESGTVDQANATLHAFEVLGTSAAQGWQRN